ncbi:MAG: hypothetical protein NZ473_02500 [Candidatus Kapabacteria bacterium]|nr:hypothetical protein [Candidatus Kapabacteria bacterium]MCS7169851.1 hypothetical protein [Candidatus Kapabacteria bacterium]MDW7996131.1 hypothetical protein [Bacteroidota bacterium]MDW8225517.1 hypothetical protein [Bacteroidota bacterium]
MWHVWLVLGPAALLAQQIPQYRLGPPEHTALAQPTSSTHPFNRFLYYGTGLQLGLMSGVGLSFRLSSPTRWGGELTAGILKLKDLSFWCLGGEVHYRLGVSPIYHAYMLAGLGYYWHTTDTKLSPVWPIRFGIGVGAETFLLEWMSLGAEVALTAYANDGAVQVFPVPQLGLMYYFR